MVEAETDLVAHVQGEEQHQHPGGGVAAVVPGPVVVHVLEEGRVEDLDLERDTGDTQAQHLDPDHPTRIGQETHLVFVHAQELLDRGVGAGGQDAVSLSAGGWWAGGRLYLQAYLTRGQSAGDPHQVQGLEGNQDEADVGRQVLGALRVHEVMGGAAPRVLLEAHRGSQIYPGIKHTLNHRAGGQQTYSLFTPGLTSH